MDAEGKKFVRRIGAPEHSERRLHFIQISGVGAVRMTVWLVGVTVFVVPVTMVISLALGGNKLPLLVDEGIIQAGWNSFLTAGLSAGLAVVVGVTVAVLLEKTDVWGKRGLRILLLSPMLVPPFVGAISWLQVFGRNQGLNRLFPRPVWDIYGADGVIFLMTLHSFPVVYVIVSAALRSIPGDLEMAARISGAKPWSVLATVTIPLLAPAMLGSFTLTFVSHFADFGIPSIIGSPVQFETLATMMYRMMESGTVPEPLQTASTIGSVLLAMAICVVVLDYFLITKTGAAAQTGSGEGLPLGRFRLPVSSVAWLVALFFTFGPLAGLTARAFLPAPGVAVVLENLTVVNFTKAFSNPRVIQALENSIALAVGAGVICCLLGLVVGVLVTRTRSRSNPVLTLIVLLPTALPGLIIGVGWLILGRYTGLYNTHWLILFAYVCAFCALVLQAVRGPLTAMSTSLEDAARVAGAGRVRSIMDTSGRLAFPSAVSGAVLVVLTAVRELTVSVLLVAPGTTTIGVQLFNLQQSGNYNQASALALIFTLVGVAGLSIVVRK